MNTNSPFELNALKRDWVEGISGVTFRQHVQKYIAQINAINDSANEQGVLVAEPDPFEFAAAFFASVYTGVPTILANPNWQRSEWEQLGKQVNPAIVFGEPGISKMQTSAVNNPRPGTILIPTGGSSGRLKLAIHTWKTLTAACRGFCSFTGYGPIHSCCTLPLYHVSGLMQLLRSFVSEGQIAFTNLKALQSGQFPEMGADKLCLSLVPTQLRRMLEPKTIADWLCRLKTIFLGGAPMMPALQARVRELNLPVVSTYGMTETAAMVTALPVKDFLSGNSSVGLPLEHAKALVVRKDGSHCLPEEKGRIHIQARSLCLGYHGSPLDISKDGYLSTDEGYLDRGGYLYVVGRSDRIIISGGENIDPLEVETAFLDTGMIAEVLAIGWPDPEWGERLIAFCVPNRKTSNAEDIHQRLRANLANYKIPKQTILLPQLPLTSQGKPDRTLIAKLL